MKSAKNLIVEKGERRFLAAILLLLFAVSIFYIYLLGLLVFKTADRNINVKKLATQRSAYQNIEKDYLLLTADLTLERAYEEGFVESKNNIFAVRRGVLASRE